MGELKTAWKMNFTELLNYLKGCHAPQELYPKSMVFLLQLSKSVTLLWEEFFTSSKIQADSFIKYNIRSYWEYFGKVEVFSVEEYSKLTFIHFVIRLYSVCSLEIESKLL